MLTAFTGMLRKEKLSNDVVNEHTFHMLMDIRIIMITLMQKWGALCGPAICIAHGAMQEMTGFGKLYGKKTLKILCDYVKENSQMRTFIHSCGSISLLMPDVPPENIVAMYNAVNEFNNR